ncbi:MAG: hypothetical protein ACLQMF_12820 [Rectinemataceae bacterium]
MVGNVREKGRPATSRARRATLPIAALAVGMLVLGCGGNAPELPAVEWRIEMRPSHEGGAYEGLSVFGDVKDSNGPEDIVELWIIQDDARLAWRLNGSTWTKRTEGGDTWIGAADLVHSDYSALTRGEYGVMVIDAAGDRTERRFRIEGGFPPYGPPTISNIGGRLRIVSSWPETLVLAFDAAGFFVASRSAPADGSSVEALFGHDIATNIRELAAYGYDPVAHAGYYSWRIPSR